MAFIWWILIFHSSIFFFPPGEARYESIRLFFLNFLVLSLYSDQEAEDHETRTTNILKQIYRIYIKTGTQPGLCTMHGFTRYCLLSVTSRYICILATRTRTSVPRDCGLAVSLGRALAWALPRAQARSKAHNFFAWTMRRYFKIFYGATCDPPK